MVHLQVRSGTSWPEVSTSTCVESNNQVARPGARLLRAWEAQHPLGLWKTLSKDM